MKAKVAGFVLLSIGILSGGYAVSLLAPILWANLVNAYRLTEKTVGANAHAFAEFQNAEPGTVGMIALVASAVLVLVGYFMWKGLPSNPRYSEDHRMEEPRMPHGRTI